MQIEQTKQQDENVTKVQKIKKNLNKRLYKFPIPKTKFELIRAILVRWWYGMPQWPIEEDYSKKLEEQKLIEVSETEAQKIEENTEGMKVFRLNNYPGMFSNANGKLFDLRNSNNKPSFNNLKQKENKELVKLLQKCIQGQIQALLKSPYYENNLEYALRKFLRRFSRVYKPILDA